MHVTFKIMHVTLKVMHLTLKIMHVALKIKSALLHVTLQKMVQTSQASQRRKVTPPPHHSLSRKIAKQISRLKTYEKATSQPTK